MSGIGTSRGRAKDAAAAQAAILDAAEAAFADHGFAGARIDAIAEASGYNKSLIFHYFDDKLGLYTAVIQRARQQSAAMQARTFASLADDSLITAEAFRAFLERAVEESFDYYLTHPRLLRIFAWEEAEGWTTFKNTLRNSTRATSNASLPLSIGPNERASFARTSRWASSWRLSRTPVEPIWTSSRPSRNSYPVRSPSRWGRWPRTASRSPGSSSTG